MKRIILTLLTGFIMFMISAPVYCASEVIENKVVVNNWRTAAEWRLI